MLIQHQKVPVKWHVRNKQRLEQLGYVYTGMGTVVLVDVEDLSNGSKSYVSVQCDYCGKIYQKVYKDYLCQHTNNKDCCKDCVAEKRGETNIIKYGGKAPSCSKTVVNKMQETCLQKYGTKTASQNEQVQNKIKQSCTAKYGVENPLLSKKIQEQIKQTNQTKYGGNSPQCDPEIRKKTMKTRYQNNNYPTSIPERHMVQMLEKLYGEQNCVAQFVLDRISFDCLISVNNVQIDVEFDGKYWHKDTHKDIRRDYYAIGKGYKVLRFKGNNNPPTVKQIQDGVNYLVNSEHHVKIIDLDT